MKKNQKLFLINVLITLAFVFFLTFTVISCGYKNHQQYSSKNSEVNKEVQVNNTEINTKKPL